MFEKLKRLLSLFFKGNSLDYICGSEALPLPFSQEEESDKISRLENGDEKAKAALKEIDRITEEWKELIQRGLSEEERAAVERYSALLAENAKRIIEREDKRSEEGR